MEQRRKRVRRERRHPAQARWSSRTACFSCTRGVPARFPRGSRTWSHDRQRGQDAARDPDRHDQRESSAENPRSSPRAVSTARTTQGHREQRCTSSWPTRSRHRAALRRQGRNNSHLSPPLKPAGAAVMRDQYLSCPRAAVLRGHDLLPQRAQASGFYLTERGVRTLGRGGAFVAGAEGAESLLDQSGRSQGRGDELPHGRQPRLPPWLLHAHGRRGRARGPRSTWTSPSCPIPLFGSHQGLRTRGLGLRLGRLRAPVRNLHVAGPR